MAYLVPWRGGIDTGPFKKVSGQAAAWRDLGVEVGLFVATTARAVPDWEALGHPGKVTAAVGSVRAKALERRELVRAVLDWAPDLVYERHALWAPALSAMSRRVATVIEVNGDDRREFRLQGRAKNAANELTRTWNYRRARALVFVTAELSRLPSYRRFGLPCQVLGNGIALEAMPELPASSEPRPGLVWLGDPRSPFQSTEQVLALAAARPQWRVDVIGPVKPAGLTCPANVTWHPNCPPEDYYPLLARADVGIGTLDAYRTGMSEASALKVREYLACGLATVIGYRDTDFPQRVPYLLQVPNRPTGLMESLAALDAFVDGWHHRRVARADVAHLDTRVKERTRLDFLQRFL